MEPPSELPSLLSSLKQGKLMQALQKLTEAAKDLLPLGVQLRLVPKPDPELMWWLGNVARFTPDIAKLEEYKWQLIFAPDELKRDHVKHDLLGADAQFKIMGYTSKNYQFWDTKNPLEGAVPLEVGKDHTQLPGYPPVTRIKGEIFAIRPQRFIDLDNHKQNGIEYFRRRVPLVVPYRKVLFLKDHSLDPAFGVTTAINRQEYSGSSVTTSEETTCIIRAWMYIGVPQHWDPILSTYDHGHVEVFSAKNRKWLEDYYSIRRPQLPPK